MKAIWLALALSCGGQALAVTGGAIGGSTGARCVERTITLNIQQLERMIDEALTTGELNVDGESMRVESLDMDEQVIRLRSHEEREFYIIWYIEIRD